MNTDDPTAAAGPSSTGEPNASHQSSSANPSFDWKQWRDLVHDAVREGREAGGSAGSGSAARLRETFEKGLYDASFGLSYAMAFGSILAKEAIIRPARSGSQQGAQAAREDAASRRESTPPTDDAGFCSI